MLDLKHAYLIGTILFLPFWLFFYFRRRDLDKKMIEVSLLVGLLAIFWSPYFWKDYWQPAYLFNFDLMGIRLGGIEDFLYGFFTGGIISVIYDEILGRRISMKKKKNHRFLILFITSILSAFIFHILLFLEVNSIHAAFMSFASFLAVILLVRKDLLWDSIISGLFFGLLTLCLSVVYLVFFPGLIQKWWLLHKVSGILLVGVPIEELVWAFGMGAVAGPLYELMMGLGIAKYKKTQS